MLHACCFHAFNFSFDLKRLRLTNIQILHRSYFDCLTVCLSPVTKASIWMELKWMIRKSFMKFIALTELM